MGVQKKEWQTNLQLSDDVDQGKMGEASTCSMCMRWQDKWIPEIQHACVDSAWQLGKALILLIQHEMNGCPTHSNLSST